MTTQKTTIHMVGHGHIDPTWLWRWTEGYEEVRATFRSALDRMNETPDFTFTASSACFYAWTRACDPELFAEIRARVREGRWEIAGGFWVEPDCNIPCGEAFVRHGLYGQAFFEDAFGRSARVGFNPDSFGHAGALPQILRGLDMDRYVFTRPAPPHEHPFPGGTTFRWQAADGSEVLGCAIPEGYNGDADHVRWAVDQLAGQSHHTPGMGHFLCFYGVGNHGGGPTKAAIAAIEDARMTAAVTVRFSTLAAYTGAIQNSMDPETLPVIAGDLQHHAQGCYTVHAGVKRWNRRAEQGLMTAERLASVAWLLAGRPVPRQRLQQAWELTLFNQFHDILAGTSLESSYEDVRDQLGAASHTATDVSNEALQRIAGSIDTTPRGNTLVVFNPLPWPVRQPVKAAPIVARGLDDPLHVVDDQEQPVAVQPVLGERIEHTDYVFTADLPALGYRCYHARSGQQAVSSEGLLAGGRTWLENEFWRLDVDPVTGWIERLYDKRAAVETVRQGNVLVCLVDQSDTWSHGYDEWRVEAGRFADARCEQVECGPVQATVRIRQRYNRSEAIQTITLYRDSDHIDCHFRINWQERYTFLKLQHETHIAQGTATCDTAYGHQIRNTGGTEEPCQMWIDLTGVIGDRPYGFAVLNDGKYGYDIRGGTLRLSLLRSPAYAFHDRARHPSDGPWPVMDQGWHSFHVQLAPHADSWREADVPRRAWELNAPAIVHGESAHPGPHPAALSVLYAEADHVALTVVKQSEDGQGLIVRGYETAGKDVDTALVMPWCDQRFPVRFRAHGIMTFRINVRQWTLEEVTLRERPIEEGS